MKKEMSLFFILFMIFILISCNKVKIDYYDYENAIFSWEQMEDSYKCIAHVKHVNDDSKNMDIETTISKEKCEPTCVKNGYIKYIASIKDDSNNYYYDPKIDEIPALGHDYTTLEGVNPTFERNGCTSKVYCNRCGETIIDSIELPKLDICDYSYKVSFSNSDNYDVLIYDTDFGI